VIFLIVAAAVAFFMFGGGFGGKTNKTDVNIKAPVPTSSP
jgi:hypothetical protein